MTSKLTCVLSSIATGTSADHQLTLGSAPQLDGVLRLEIFTDKPEADNSDNRIDLSFPITLDNPGPLVSLTSPLHLDATGPLTRVDLRGVTATDAPDTAVNLVASRTGLFASGSHVITWTAIDSDSNVTLREQVMEIRPIVRLQTNQMVAEGAALNVGVLLSGPAVTYPLTVRYDVSGTVDSAAYTGLTGELVIALGRRGTISADILADGVAEEDETLVITLTGADQAVLANLIAHQSTITEDNLAPVPTLRCARIVCSDRLLMLMRAK